MAPRRAAAYIKSFGLPEEEETLLIACDVRRLSYVQAAVEYHLTPEVIKRRKNSAYAHIADALNNK